MFTGDVMTVHKTDFRHGLLELVGETPLIKLEGLSKATGCTILGKAEFLNPTGSVKDRAAKAILEKAEAEGKLKKGGTVVEGTSGNTGISLAHYCNAKGYRCIIVMPENMAQDKVDILRALEAQVRLSPPSRYGKPGNYAEIAKKLAEGIPGGLFANQFENLANYEAHLTSTGPEIWKQTGGMVGWVCVWRRHRRHVGRRLRVPEKAKQGDHDLAGRPARFGAAGACEPPGGTRGGALDGGGRWKPGQDDELCQSEAGRGGPNLGPGSHRNGLLPHAYRGAVPWGFGRHELCGSGPDGEEAGVWEDCGDDSL